MNDNIIIYKTEFVDKFNFTGKEGIIYYSKKLEHTLHLCPCGCGVHVALPTDDKGWSMKMDKFNCITIAPSIRNRSCGSHYYIKNNEAEWSK